MYSNPSLVRIFLNFNSDNIRNKDVRLTRQATLILQETTLTGTWFTQGFINCLFAYLIKMLSQNSDEQALQKFLV